MITNYFQNLIRDTELHIGSTNFPDEYYLGFSTTVPNADGTGVNEPTEGSYTRVDVGDWEADAQTAGKASNENEILFPETTGSWGTLTNYVIFDALTGGNLLMANTLTVPRIMEQTEMQIKVNPGALSIIIGDGVVDLQE
ncbi:hypothetical protein FACS189490_02000 [Clostridia bacterium]|nr:hypothetical protein FACS189490_02000 [Clostridia bacterium]